jgi:hypothetical protein
MLEVREIAQNAPAKEVRTVVRWNVLPQRQYDFSRWFSGSIKPVS